MGEQGHCARCVSLESWAEEWQWLLGQADAVSGMAAIVGCLFRSWFRIGTLSLLPGLSAKASCMAKLNFPEPRKGASPMEVNLEQEILAASGLKELRMPKMHSQGVVALEFGPGTLDPLSVVPYCICVTWLCIHRHTQKPHYGFVVFVGVHAHTCTLTVLPLNSNFYSLGSILPRANPSIFE